MQELQDVYTIDKRYVAPRQGNIKIQPLTWLKAYPKYPVIFASLSLLALVLSMTISFWFLFLFAFLIIVVNGFYWKNVQEHFNHGALISGKVVFNEPSKIAFVTDLSKGEGSYQAIKVIEKKLLDESGKPLIHGQKVTAVALYYEHLKGEYPFFKDVDPRPIQTATSDQRVIKHSVNQISDEEWQAVSEMIDLLPQNPAAGLYLIFDEEGEIKIGKVGN